MLVVEHVTSRAETIGGISGSNDGDAELVFHVLGCGSALMARAAVLNGIIGQFPPVFAPPTYHNLVQGPMQLTPLGAGMWSAKVKYTGIKNKIKVRMSCMAEKVKFMKSRQTMHNVRVHYTGAELLPAPSYKNLIGVSKDKVEGCDFWDPGTFKLSMQWSSDFLSITSSYIDTVMQMEATVNQTDLIFNYKGQQLTFFRGDLVFIGGDFEETSSDGCSISLSFEGRLADALVKAGDLDGGVIGPFAATIAIGNAVVSGIASTTDLRAGMAVAGGGIPDGTRILFVQDATTIIVDTLPTGTGPTTLNISNPYLPRKEGWWYVWLTTTKVPVREGTTVVGSVEVPDTAHIERMAEYSDFSRLEVFDTVNAQVPRPPTDGGADGDAVGGGGGGDWDAEEVEQGGGDWGPAPLPEGFGQGPQGLI